MSLFLIVIMVALLIAALNRNARRQPPYPTYPPYPHGANQQDDRDWARTQLELSALGDEGGTRPYQHLPRLF